MTGRPDEDAFLLDVAKALYPRLHDIVRDEGEARNLVQGLGKAVAKAEAGQRASGLASVLGSNPKTRELVGLTIIRLEGGKAPLLDDLLGRKDAKRLIAGINANGHHPLPKTQALFYAPLAGRPRPIPSLAEQARPPKPRRTEPDRTSPPGTPPAPPTTKAKARRYKCTFCSYEASLPSGKKRAQRCPVDGAVLVAA